MLKLGNKSISNLFIGQKAAVKAFLGQKLVWQKATGLPYDAEVEYLESTSNGGQWIDTGYLFTSNTTKVEAQFYSTQIGGQVLFGSEESTPNRTLTPLLYVDGNNKFSVFIARSPRAINKVDAAAGLYSVTIESDSTGQIDFNCNGTVYSGTFTGDVYRDLPIALFAERFPTKIDYYSKNLKLYSFKIYDNGVLVRDLIPVRVGGVGYMYDRVSGQLFSNQGSGNFIVGPDVVEVEYLESTGTQWILTDFSPKTTTDYEVEFSSTYTGTNNWVIGCPTWIGIHYKGATNEVGVTNGSTSPYQQYTSYAHDNSRITLKLQGNIVYANGVSLGTITRSNAYNNLDLALFAYRDVNQGASLQFKGSIYKAKIWDNNVLVRDFVPVRVGMEGAMKDKVTGKIYRNQGTGAFKIGADKKETPLMCNSYVKDGLVAMWDVIENISLGESDHSQPYVYNIAPNGPAFTIGNVTFDEATISYSTPSSTQHVKIDPALVDGFVNRNCTVEFLAAEANASANGWGAAANPSVDGFAYVFVSTGNNFLRVSKDGTQTSDQLSPTDKLHSSVVISGNTMSSYCGGAFDKSATFSSQGYQYVTQFGFLSIPRYNSSHASGMRCFRLYSRALTAEEIARNYEIDRRRFGLT